MYIIRKLFKLELAHQLHSCYSACCKETIHGHSYTLEVFFASQELDQDGMVVDFGEIKDLLNGYVASWDHSLVLCDKMSIAYLQMLEKYNKNLKIVSYNPTAENMANDIYWSIARLIQPHLEATQRKFQLWKILLHETDKGYAEYQPMQFEEKAWKDVLLDGSLKTAVNELKEAVEAKYPSFEV